MVKIVQIRHTFYKYLHTAMTTAVTALPCMALHRVTIISVTDFVNLVTRLSITTDALVTTLPTVTNVTNFHLPTKLFNSKKISCLLNSHLVRRQTASCSGRRRPEHKTVKVPKLEFPLLFRTAARDSRGNIEELHAGQHHTACQASGLCSPTTASVPLLGFKPQFLIVPPVRQSLR